MAGGEKWEEPTIAPEQELRSMLAYRDDLAESIGIIVSQPPHRLDDQGRLIWGAWLGGGIVQSDHVYRELETTLARAVEQEYAKAEGLPPLDRTLPTHSYDHPPAAQSIPEIAAIIWEHGRPILESGVLLYEAGKLIRASTSRVRKWYDKINEQISELNRPYYDRGETPPHEHVQPGITLTQGALVALIVADIVDSVGFQPDLEVDAHARGFLGYNSPDHPNARLTYLVRVAYGGAQYGYVLESSGKVIEYFRVEEREFISLPFPSLLSDETIKIDQYSDQPSDKKLRLRME